MNCFQCKTSEVSPIYLHISDTKVYEKVCELILNTRLCKDIRKLSPRVQTSAVEAVHSLTLHWSPKMTAFGYRGMIIR